MDIGRCLIPGVEFTLWSFKVLPHLGTVQDNVVVVNEHFWAETAVGQVCDFLSGWPDVLKENIFAI
jgi:hypothetical protein